MAGVLRRRHARTDPSLEPPAPAVRPAGLRPGPALRPLVPTVALLHLLAALATSRAHMRRFSFSWSLAAEAIRLATFSCKEPWVLIGLLVVSTIPPYVELLIRRRPTAGLRDPAWPSSSPCWSWGGRRSKPARAEWPAPWWATIPLLLAILIRCGTVPAHCWLTDWFEHASSWGSRLLYVVPLSGVYVAVRLLLPHCRSRPGWVPEQHRFLLARHGRLRRRDGHHPAASAAILRSPVLEPRLARARRARDCTPISSLTELALPLVFRHPLPGRVFGLTLRAPGGPGRPPFADRLSRPLRTFTNAGRLLPINGPGQRRFSGHARLHLDRIARG